MEADHFENTAPKKDRLITPLTIVTFCTLLITNGVLPIAMSIYIADECYYRASLMLSVSSIMPSGGIVENLNNTCSLIQVPHACNDFWSCTNWLCEANNNNATRFVAFQPGGLTNINCQNTLEGAKSRQSDKVTDIYDNVIILVDSVKFTTIVFSIIFGISWLISCILALAPSYIRSIEMSANRLYTLIIIGLILASSINQIMREYYLYASVTMVINLKKALIMDGYQGLPSFISTIEDQSIAFLNVHITMICITDILGNILFALFCNFKSTAKNVHEALTKIP